jgi:anti-anti-sigma factor
VRDSAVQISLRGNADISTRDKLEAALDDVAVDGHKAVCLDLSGLDFIDVGSLRHLTTFAGNLRQNGCDVTTVGVPPFLRSVIRLLPWEAELGLASPDSHADHH